MATGSLQELQAHCKQLGVPGSLIRRHMNDADQLQSLIESFEKGKAHVQEVRKKMARKPVARAKAKSAGRPRPKRITLKKRETVEEVKPTRRRKPATRKAASTTPRKRQVQKQTTSKRTSTPRKTSDEAGRHMLGKLNFTKTTNWNPREGSITSDIFEALKQTKGDRDKTYTLLLKWYPLSEWIPLRKRDGSKRTKQEQENMLHYRIARTLWDFAIQTGQHAASENRSNAANGKPKGRKPAATTTATRKKRTTTAKATTTARKATTTRGRKPAARRRARARR